MVERFRTIVDVHVLLRGPDGSVLLMERANTGYADGQAGVPSGHLEPGENIVDAAIRETSEEVGVVIEPEDLEFVHVSHRRKPGEEGRVGFFFAASRWIGEPANCEPHKCARIWWADPADLPKETVDYVADAIVRDREFAGRFSLFGWS
jgi:8-oxo-dGTP diphosphatase